MYLSIAHRYVWVGLVFFKGQAATGFLLWCPRHCGAVPNLVIWSCPGALFVGLPISFETFEPFRPRVLRWSQNHCCRVLQKSPTVVCSCLACGTGGVMQLTNIDPEVADQIYKLFSMILCANTLGQATKHQTSGKKLPQRALTLAFAMFLVCQA